MWIVRLALRRPYTFVVCSILVLMLGIYVIVVTPKDIFPTIDIPVVSVMWNYEGLSAPDIAARIVTNSERAMSTTVNDIEHIESQSLNGRSVIKVFFQPSVRIDMAIAQVTAISQTLLHGMPPGTNPPLIVVYTASSVPILQLALSGQGMSEQQLFDLAVNFVRTRLITVPGAAVPWAYGGKQRQVQVDLDFPSLQAKGLSPQDVVNAISDQNLILPAGTSKIGTFEYNVEMNGSPRTVAELNDLPIKSVSGATIYIRDVAHVRDGFPPQTNIVRVNGQRASLLTILKFGGFSTLDIISGVKKVLPSIAQALPSKLEMRPLADQSIFVRAAISGVVQEALLAACLTGLMILVFLGSWRSTLIIAISIPLSILTSIIVMRALGETINIMTLGGLALAVGILVDDATVEIENINRNLALGKETEQGILDGAQQIAVPAFVSTLSICIVFVPMFFLTGVARYLFVPLAEAVVFAMLASYLLSRTLVPTMAKYLLRGHVHAERLYVTVGKNWLWRQQIRFEVGFERMRAAYHNLLEACIKSKRVFALGFLAFCVASFALVPLLGEDFFPAVDSGQFKLHFRAHTGTRIEETASLCDRVEDVIREVVPPREIASVIDNIGLPYSSINLSYSNSAPIGPADADILVSLNRGHRPTEEYVHDLRMRLNQRFSGVTFAFLPADMVSQILNFGLPAPIDVQVVGYDVEGNRNFADHLLSRLKQVPGTVDLRIQQAFDAPKLDVTVDRTLASAAGYTTRDAATNLLISLSGSFQTSPTFWLDPRTGVSYSITTQTPQYRLDSLQDLQNIPMTGSGRSRPEILASLASIRRGQEMGVVSHYDVAPVIDIYGSVQGRDLGGVAGDISRIVNDSSRDLPRGSRLIVRGQIQTMWSSYFGLLGGLAFSIVLVYLLIVVNFQSWLDPFIIISALPAALAGIVWMLFVSETAISVPALTGAIMCMGVATSNSILVISFAKEQLRGGREAADAASQAGFTRFRPVIMTALAMIIGMFPMAIGMGEGAEQNAPLGRAVIGGLIFATISTLFFVPVLFSWIHGWRQSRHAAG
ncbi:MAG TPA: efflux RND transporter permease subunit [Candidatus Acidoferrales bacterium]|nr:efflux RND transporter permease subunit [Candidatus Acidoferrales bacterium]